MVRGELWKLGEARNIIGDGGSGNRCCVRPRFGMGEMTNVEIGRWWVTGTMGEENDKMGK